MLGWTPPGGKPGRHRCTARRLLRPEGRLHYAGGVGSGFDDKELGAIRKRLDDMGGASHGFWSQAIRSIGPSPGSGPRWSSRCSSPTGRAPGGCGIPCISGSGRTSRPARWFARGRPRGGARGVQTRPWPSRSVTTRKGWHGAVPPLRSRRGRIAAPMVPQAPSSSRRRRRRRQSPWRAFSSRIPTASYGRASASRIWRSIGRRYPRVALPGIAQRPLSILRCPDGINGKEQFFQKNGHGIMPCAIREGSVSKQPYLAIDDVEGLISMAQMSAIELHAWGANEIRPAPTGSCSISIPARACPGARWSRRPTKCATGCDLGLASFCRTTGGKGLHVVVPLRPEADWSVAKPFCRAFAEAMAQEDPTRFLAHLKIADRRGRILVDWLRNGLGATAVASFSPRARPGATVATPVTWAEVTPKLDPSLFTIRTVPERLARLKRDPWQGFEKAAQHLPSLVLARSTAPAASEASHVALSAPKPRSSIVTARPPKPRRG